MKPYEITKKIQKLESFYADCLGNNANHAQLDSIWRKIKTLKSQLFFAEIVESVQFSSEIMRQSDPASAFHTKRLRQGGQQPGAPALPEGES